MTIIYIYIHLYVIRSIIAKQWHDDANEKEHEDAAMHHLYITHTYIYRTKTLIAYVLQTYSLPMPVHNFYLFLGPVYSAVGNHQLQSFSRGAVWWCSSRPSLWSGRGYHKSRPQRTWNDFIIWVWLWIVYVHIIFWIIYGLEIIHGL